MSSDNENVFYDPSHPAGFGGINKFSKATHQSARKAQQWLQSQRTYTLHKPARKGGYPTRPYRTKGVDYQWQGDLVEMIPHAKINKGYKYILMLIDIFSRYAFARPLKNKTPNEVVNALKSVFQESGRKPLMYLQTDQGKEFENKTVHAFLQKHGIKQFSVKSQFKASIVERLNRTIKIKMYRYFTHIGNYKWLDVLPKLIESYNASVHRMIGMAPKDVNKRNEFELWQAQQDSNNNNAVKTKKKLLQVGDFVRVSRAKHVFAKGYENQWTEEIFTITDVIKRPDNSPVTYKIQDYEGTPIEGVFYAEEVQRVAKPDVFSVEKILKTKVQPDGSKMHLVKWQGYKQPTWTTSNIIKK